MSTNEYTIKGLISIQITMRDNKIEYNLFLLPNTGYYSADQKFAIAFPLDDNTDKQFALLLPMEDKKCNLKVLNKEVGDSLFQIASQQKPITLELKIDNDIATVVGFMYPSI